MWVRTQIKIGWGDLAAGLLKSYVPPSRAAEAARAESFFSDDATWMASYSVRTGFEILLKALDLKPGDEVIFSAVNVRGMVKIVSEMGLVPVPVDIGFGDMSPSPRLLEAAITPRSKVFVAAHLFGTRAKLDNVFRVAKAHGLLAVEDCAQAFNGRDYPGDTRGDVTMFSFGPIKTATALGGALLRVKDAALLSRMRALQAEYPVQTDAKQRKRLVSAAGLKIVSSPPVLGLVYRYYKARGRNYEEELANHVRDVAPLKQKGGLRYQPSASLLWMMNRRMRQLSSRNLALRTAKGSRLASRLGDMAALPGQAASHHDYWLFAVVTDKPEALMEALRQEGFDAGGLPRSQTVDAPVDRAALGPVLAKDMLDSVVVVPCYESMPDREIDREAEIIGRALAASGSASSLDLARRMDAREQA
jgi:perosamine synthetase